MSRKLLTFMGLLVIFVAAFSVWSEQRTRLQQRQNSLNRDLVAAVETGLMDNWQYQHEDPELVRLLLEKGANPDCRDADQEPLIAVAAGHSQAVIVKLLLRYGADVNAANAHGKTPLMAAAETGQVETIKLLLRSGADVQAQTDQGWGGDALTEANDALLQYKSDLEHLSLPMPRNLPVTDRHEFTSQKASAAGHVRRYKTIITLLTQAAEKAGDQQVRR